VAEALNTYLLPVVLITEAYPLIKLTGSNHLYEVHIKVSISSQMDLLFN